MTNIVIIQAHPDPSSDTLSSALGEAYGIGAQEGGHEFEYFDLAQIDFPVLRSQEDWMAGKEATPKALKPLQRAVVKADHVVIVFPLWFGSIPAYSKAAIEQVFRPGVALAYEGKFPKPLMKGKTIRVIVTMSTPAWAYRFYFGQPALSLLKRHIFGLAGFSSFRSTVFGGVDGASDATIGGWRSAVKELGIAGV